MLQARPGKNFHQKLYISDDSKIFLQICTVDLLSTSSAWQASMVENVKLKHDLDTIFWNFCMIFLHRVMLWCNVYISLIVLYIAVFLHFLYTVTLLHCCIDSFDQLDSELP